MQYIYLLSAIPFIVTSIVFFVKYKQWKEKQETVNSKYQNLILDVHELNSPLREGYFSDKVKFVKEKSSTDFDEYDCIVYVQELDRYTNGDSKIKLKKVEVINGFSRNIYPDVRDVITKKFCSIKPTKDIEWLESEEDLKTQRKKKLTLILEKTNK